MSAVVKVKNVERNGDSPFNLSLLQTHPHTLSLISLTHTHTHTLPLSLSLVKKNGRMN
jgi:hypothetical protein